MPRPGSMLRRSFSAGGCSNNHALDQGAAHYFHGDLVRRPVLPAATVRLSRNRRGCGEPGAVQDHGAQALLGHHGAGRGADRRLPGMLVAFDFQDMNAKNITLRPGRPTDAAKIAAMSRDLIETGLGWSWGPERVARSIANKDTFTLLACDRDRVVAFAIMYFGDEHAHLNLLAVRDRKSTRLNSSHLVISYAVFC